MTLGRATLQLGRPKGGFGGLRPVHRSLHPQAGPESLASRVSVSVSRIWRWRVGFPCRQAALQCRESEICVGQSGFSLGESGYSVGQSHRHR